MADLGISDVMMDYEGLFENLEDAEFGVQYHRITQTLMEAGIDINMLSKMDLARISSALWADNTLFEEGGGLMMMYRQSYGLMDSMHLDESETGQSLLDDEINKITNGYSQLSGNEEAYLEQWNSRSNDEKEAAMRGWMPALVLGKDKPSLAPVMVAEAAPAPHPFENLAGIGAALTGLGAAATAGINAVSFEEVKALQPSGAVSDEKGETYWRDFVTAQKSAEREESQAASTPIDGETHVERLEQRIAREAELEEQVSTG